MKKNVFNIIFYGLIVIVVLFVLIAVIPGTLFAPTVTIEVVENYTYDDCIDFYGMAIRDECMIASDKAHSFVEYAVEDGKRVAKGSTVAYYTVGSDEISDYKEINYLNKKIDILTEIISSNVQSSSVVLEQDNQNKISDFLSKCDAQDLRMVDIALSEVHMALSKKDVKLNGNDKYVSALTEFSKRKTDLLSVKNEQEYPVKTAEAGYFYSGYDGFEHLKLRDIEGITVEKLNALLNQEPIVISDTYIGKVQNSPVWYFSGLFDSDVVSGLNESESVILKFNYSDGSIRNISATVYEVSNNSEGKTAVLFECSTLTDKEFSLRKGDCSLVVNTYNGLKISNSALRVVDGQDGVYVLVGQKVTFKPVTILYSGDTFSIVQPSSSTSAKTLTANDEVVCGGKDMFDGKVINVQ